MYLLGQQVLTKIFHSITKSWLVNKFSCLSFILNIQQFIFFKYCFGILCNVLVSNLISVFLIISIS